MTCYLKVVTTMVRLAIALSCLAALPALATWSSAQNSSDWSPPVNLGPPVNSPFTEIGPAISKNELSLYISSDRPGGFGGEDIWVSRRASRNDAWGPPVNLGPSSARSPRAGGREDRRTGLAQPRPPGL